jgi:hypothetical protein
VLFAVVLIYVVIMGIRLGRVERELDELLSEGPEEPDQAAEEEDLDISRAGSTVA